MKHVWILTTLLVALCCGAQTGRANPGSTHAVTISEDQNGQTVTVHKGDDIVVTFVAAGGTGYAWQMEPNKLAVAKEEDAVQQPGLPGGPVKVMFHVKARWTVTLKFDFFRSWEKNTPPAKTFSVTLQVR